MTDQASQTPTHVVTSFLLRRDRGHDAILLVRRSERVRTYRGAWAGISGYLEPGVTPLEQAYTELREETSFAQSDVRLLRTGQPIPVEDAENSLSWVVHPFLFEALRPEALRTDWEATGFQWIAPETLPTLPTVPRLAEAFAAVYPA
jgi:ADP-ribose pyrophosphatase YjhB (NUDIX family)